MIQEDLHENAIKMLVVSYALGMEGFVMKEED